MDEEILFNPTGDKGLSKINKDRAKRVQHENDRLLRINQETKIGAYILKINGRLE